MSIHPGHLEALLEQINAGQAAAALPELERLQAQLPTHPAVLSLRAEALRLAGRPAEAIVAFKQAGEQGAGARSWLAAGVLLAAERATDDAMQCLLKAAAGTPDSEEVLDALITTLFNGNRHREGIEFARRQLALSTNPTLLSRAALLLQANDLYEESSDAFKKILQMGPDDPAIIGGALVPARFTCEWEWIESLQSKLGRFYEQGRFDLPQEFPLTHITWCADEARNLGVTRAYVERVVPAVERVPARAHRRVGGRIRIGYLSSDFRNHATMHLMAGVFEHHDRERFEVFAYDYTAPDISDYRQRFLEAVEHHVPIHLISDRQAAARIAADELDILFDLKLYTGGGRAGIAAHRPAPVQAAYIGFPGSAAHPEIDYVVSDRFVTPDSSAPYYTEKLCRLPHSYQCNDHKRFAAPAPGTRAMYGLPEGKIVFGAFNQSYKIDRGSFAVWMRILTEVPDCVLWLLGQSEAAVANLTRHAQLAGIGPERLIFAPFAAPHAHFARLPAADAILDALVCNGHTTTSDALWAGVPVITARGAHFASRVSESLLNAMELAELVGSDQDEMVRIAKRVASDSDYRALLRTKVATNRLSAPLFDTARFTRDFETAIELMVERQRNGLAPDHIDVPDRGRVPARTNLAGQLKIVKLPGRVSGLQKAYSGCPLCEGASVTLGFANCTKHPLWHEPLPPTIAWLRCAACGHVHNQSYWTETGLTEIQRSEPADTFALPPAKLEAQRAAWAPVVDKVVGLLGGYRTVLNGAARPTWVDVGCGDGTLIMTATDSGIAAIGLETRAAAVAKIQSLGLNTLQHDYLPLNFEITPDVLSMMDVLEQIPFPREALRKAARVLRPGGVLVVSTADMGASSWRAMEAQQVNPYWTDPERLHNFNRDQLVALLRDCGFEIADFAIPKRAMAQMEIYAVRKP
jgi:predicted O-linked N-acetylglucosamine transferase (SPINDLY family)/2-polyprenyl-3-methyl-5-hydroxy-6-metoxy-1,4-benzoquinol methylase